MKRFALLAVALFMASALSAQTYTGTITSSTTVVGPFASSSRNIVSVSISGAYAGLSAVFEFNDGVSTSWYAAYGVRTDASIQEFGPISMSNAARMWDVSTFNTQQFRIRVTNFESGTANVVVVMSGAPIEAAATVVTAPGSVVQVTGTTPGSPGILPVNAVTAPPPLTPLQLSNPLLYRAALRVYCQTNLAGCGPSL